MYVYPQLSCATRNLALVQKCVAENKPSDLVVNVSDQVDASVGLIFDVSNPAGQRVAKLTFCAAQSLGWHTLEGQARLANDILDQLQRIR
jgi:hypothetical protein